MSVLALLLACSTTETPYEAGPAPSFMEPTSSDSTLSALGTQPGCGFDCAEECVEYTPDDDCWTDYQAIALGILSFEISGIGTATLSNSDSTYDICLEGFAMWDYPDSQSLVVGEEVLLGSTYRIPAGGALELA